MSLSLLEVDRTKNGGPAFLVAKLLTQILGRGVTARPVPALPLLSPAPKVVAAYEEDGRSLASVCVCDLNFAVHASAALLLTPVDAAEESIELGTCDPALLDALVEIFNIGRRWFQTEGRHIDSPRLYATPDPLPSRVSAAMASPKHRVDLEVTIAGYGAGHLSVVI